MCGWRSRNRIVVSSFLRSWRSSRSRRCYSWFASRTGARNLARGGARAMRRALGALMAAALVAGVALFVHRPRPLDAQAGGALEGTGTDMGAPRGEKLQIKKDTQQGGTGGGVEKGAGGANKGLAHA